MTQSSPLLHRYVRVLMVCMGSLTLIVGLFHLGMVAATSRRSVAELLHAEAQTASGQIQGFLDGMVSALHWIDDIDEPGTAEDYEVIREASYRLLRRAPSLVGIAFLDHRGCERLILSRTEPDILTSACHDPSGQDPRSDLFKPTRAAGVYFGPVFTADGSEPHQYIGVASRGRGTGVLIAEINLKVIHDSVASIHVGRSGIAFVADANGRLIAHPDQSLVLKQSRVPHDLLRVPAFAQLNYAIDFTGQRVSTASQSIIGPGWTVVVSEPVSEALAPLYSALWTTGALVAAAILSSLLAGFIVARRLTRPLARLREGAAQIEKGDLSTQLSISTGDEIEEVANGFNRMARALAESRAELEAKVINRTAALQKTTLTVQQQADELTELNLALAVSLQEAKRREEDAERANAAKSRFLAVASHDLRQPMHAVSLLVGLLSERIHSPELSDVVEKVQGSVDAMGELFNALLDISKLDAGAMHPTVEDVALCDVLSRVRHTFQPLAEAKGLSFSTSISPATVRSDANLLERVLQNLVSNAIRYTVTGRVDVSVTIVAEGVQIDVADTGIGIPEAYHSRIFDEFFQIVGPSHDRSKGLGLGLSIVKRCTELLGHQLEVRSGPAGSVFTVLLPLIRISEGVPYVPSIARNVSPRLASAFVIVIDDDNDSRIAAKMAYQHWGCHVLTAESSWSAINALKEHLRDPDLIVSDFYLNAGDTGDVAVDLVRHHAESLIPAIVLSGDSASVNAPSLKHPYVVLQKPVSSERLKEVSERLLAESMPGIHLKSSTLKS